jgi:hypothetical protein
MQLSYNKATLYGNSIVDYVWIKNYVAEQSEIDTVSAYTYSPQWDDTTLMLAPFNSDINGGNVVGLSDNVIAWQIYKRKPDDSVFTFVAKVPAAQYKVSDFNVLNNDEYQYTIFAETENYISAPLEQKDFVKASWWNWSIVGLNDSGTNGLYYADSDNIWLFDTMLTSSGFDQNIDKYIVENFTQFPKISSGKKNYLSSSITAFLNNIKDGRYVDTVEQYNRFVDFIAQPTPKLLRDRKGNGWVVSTMGNNMRYIDESVEQITQVSFNFVQLNDIQSVNVIGG